MSRSELPDGLRKELGVERDSDVPIGTQLTWGLERLIGSGALAPGQQLPSVRLLAEVAGVNVNTVRAVYARLEERGLLASEHGRGTFVRGADEPHGNGSEREYRRELMRQIAELERQAAYYTRHLPAASPARGSTRRPASQLQPAAELIEIREELQERVTTLRRAEEAPSAARRTRSTAAEPPSIVSTPGAWVLKWRT